METSQSEDILGPNMPMAQLKLEIKEEIDFQSGQSITASSKEDMASLDLMEDATPKYYIKSETIVQDEVNIKEEDEWDEDQLDKKNLHFKEYFQCSDCPYKTVYKGVIEKHFNKHRESKGIIAYNCSGCQYKTHIKGNMRRHLKVHNNHLISKCLKCPYETWNRAEFKKHRLEHMIDQQWLHCGQCTFKTPIKASMTVHMLTHRVDPFRCSDCSYRTEVKSRLDAHRVRHEKKKFHACPSCPFRTYKKCNLQVHFLLHTPSDQIQWFKCEECPFKTIRERGLKAHQLIHKKPEEIHWFYCYNCSYKANRKSSMKSHMTTHKLSINRF